MTPRPNGQTVGMVRVGLAALPEAELARLAHQMWRCATCSHVEADASPARLRRLAKLHTETCVVRQLHAQTVAAD